MSALWRQRSTRRFALVMAAAVVALSALAGNALLGDTVHAVTVLSDAELDRSWGASDCRCCATYTCSLAWISAQNGCERCGIDGLALTTPRQICCSDQAEDETCGMGAFGCGTFDRYTANPWLDLEHDCPRCLAQTGVVWVKGGKCFQVFTQCGSTSTGCSPHVQT